MPSPRVIGSNEEDDECTELVTTSANSHGDDPTKRSDPQVAVDDIDFGLDLRSNLRLVLSACVLLSLVVLWFFGIFSLGSEPEKYDRHEIGKHTDVSPMATTATVATTTVFSRSDVGQVADSSAENMQSAKAVLPEATSTTVIRVRNSDPVGPSSSQTPQIQAPDTITSIIFSADVSTTAPPSVPVPASPTDPKYCIHVTIEFSGRIGNLMFEWASMIGIKHRLAAAHPDATFDTLTWNEAKAQTSIVGGLIDTADVPALGFFNHFQLQRFTGVDDLIRDSLLGRGKNKCSLSVSESAKRYFGSQSYNRSLVPAVASFVARRKKNVFGCKNKKAGLVVKLDGYFQNHGYWDDAPGGATELIRQAFAVPPNTQREADEFITSVRNKLTTTSSEPWQLIGVQVRRGDKEKDPAYTSVYVSVGWDFYRAGVRKLKKSMGRNTAIIVTAGGTMAGNAADVAEASVNLAGGDVFFSQALDPYVDMAILMACDGLVIGSSSFGWWAAYLSKAHRSALVVAPSMMYKASHELAPGFDAASYYPRTWALLDPEHVADT